MTGDFEAIKIAAFDAIFKAQGEHSPENMRALYAALGAVLEAYGRQFGALGLPAGVQPQLIPPEIALLVGAEFSELGRGRMPQPMADCIGRGAAPVTWREATDIRTAVAYVEYFKGAAPRFDPIRVVMRLFRVKRRTVLDWCNKFPPIEYRGGRALRLSTIAAAARYRNGGRSRDATTIRAGKRARG